MTLDVSITTPRIDISRASSSSQHEDSRDSSPENVFDQVYLRQQRTGHGSSISSLPDWWSLYESNLLTKFFSPGFFSSSSSIWTPKKPITKPSNSIWFWILCDCDIVFIFVHHPVTWHPPPQPPLTTTTTTSACLPPPILSLMLCEWLLACVVWVGSDWHGHITRQCHWARISRGRRPRIAELHGGVVFYGAGPATILQCSTATATTG